MFGRATIRLGIGPHSSYIRFKPEANDVLPNINRTQAATYRSHFARAVCALPSPPAATEWSRLLLNDVICSESVTVHVFNGKEICPW